MLSFNFSPFPQLETERLLLKQITPRDIDALFGLRSNEEVMKYLDRPLAKAREEAEALIKVITEALQKNDAITWGISLKENPDLLRGTVGFWKVEKEHYRAEIGYMLDPDLQGKGIMSEAIATVLFYGFDTMKLHSVEANVNPQNAASIRLLERKGFMREAYFKENYFYNGQFLDSAIYSLLTPLR